MSGSRHRAREAAFRTAYQAEVTGDPHRETWQSRREEEALADDQAEFVTEIARHLDHELPAVDAEIQQAAEHWPLARLSATDRAVLRIATAELAIHAGTPARVVLDEAIEIAKRFGSAESGRFVNGVLDRVARRMRPAEFS